jgi:hypothetical protein
MDNAPAQRQRSPWFYVLLGCGGLAGLMCLSGAIFVLFVGKQVKNMSDGVTDPAERTRNAVEQLGAVPEGYSVAASMSVFGALKVSVMTDQPLLADGGFSIGGRLFTYYRLMASQQNKASRDFFTGATQDDPSLRQRGVNVDAKAVFKRGELSVDGRRISYVVARGPARGPAVVQGGPGAEGGAGPDGLNTTFMFDCPDEALRVGVWSQPDPDPSKAPEELDLAGTVADEAQLARLIKPVNPCGK